MKLVALHGFTGSGRDFDPLAEALSVPVQAIDLLGHGEAELSARQADYRVASQVIRIAEQLDEQPMVLLGYSMGGRVALRLWSLLGSRLRGVILIATSPGLVDPVERTERIAKDMALASQIEEHGIEWFVEYWANHPVIRTQGQIEPAILEAMRARRMQNSVVGLANTLRGLGQGAVEPVWAALTALTLPTLLLTGSEDPQYTAISEEMAQVMPNAIHRVIDGAGHCAHLESLDESVSIIREFLNSLSE